VPEWLFAASYDAVGDLAETVALLLPAPSRDDDRPLADWIEHTLAPLPGLPPEEVVATLHAAWDALPREGRLVLNKLITGAFRVGVARQLVLRALAQVAGAPVADAAHRLAGDWVPDERFWARIAGAGDDDAHRPYPFMLAHALDADVTALGAANAWQAEWKWDGVRAQIVARGGAPCIWSRGEELVGEAFPELAAAAATLPPGTVIDGEILVWPQGAPAPRPFATLQRRLNRRSPGAKLRSEAPVAFVAFDLLEHEGRDVRARPLAQRRALLDALPAAPIVRRSPATVAADWSVVAAMREEARVRHAEGVMLKRLDAPYQGGRVRGAWWKWKLDPWRIDAVLVYAQPGHGRRASLFTDYTFAVWDGPVLVPFAKAYSGLRDEEILRVDAWIRSHTLERFGPVRRVEPALVFELAFEGVQRSARHKSGIAVRFPRIARWRSDKSAADADTIAALLALAAGEED